MMIAQYGQQIQHQHIKHTSTLYCVCMENNHVHHPMFTFTHSQILIWKTPIIGNLS